MDNEAIDTLRALDAAKAAIREMRELKDYETATHHTGKTNERPLKRALDLIDESVGKARDLEAERLGDCVCGHEVCAHVPGAQDRRSAGLYQVAGGPWHTLEPTVTPRGDSLMVHVPDATRGDLIAALATMPDEAFGWFVLACPRSAMTKGGNAQIWPDGMGGFSPASQASVEAVRTAADVLGGR